MGKRVGWVAAFVVAAVVVLVTPAGAMTTPPPTPNRVALVGDSLTAQYQDEAAARLPGWIVDKVGKGGTGLLDIDRCHGQWAKYVATLHAALVVVEYVGNGTPTSGHPQCAPARYGTTAWLNVWKREVLRFDRIVSKGGTRVVWIQAPNSIRDPYAQNIPKLNAMYAALGTPVINAAWPYDPAMHTEDGLHLSQAGQDRLAQQVASFVTG